MSETLKVAVRVERENGTRFGNETEKVAPEDLRKRLHRLADLTADYYERVTFGEGGDG